MNRTALRFIFIMLFAATILSSTSAQSSKAARDTLLAIGFEESPVSTLANFTDTTVDGKKISLADTKGKVFIFNSWATWCGPCVSEMPSMQKLYDRYKNNPNFRMLACSDEDKNTVTTFVRQKRFTFPIAATSSSFDSYGFQYIPTTLVVDRTGKVIAQMVGGTEWDSPEIYKAIDLLLATTGTSTSAAPATAPSTTGSGVLELNTGLSDASFLSSLEADIIRELNMVRTDPRGYAAKLRRYRSLYRGNNVVEPGKVTLMTNEGVRAVDEAIAVLEQTAPLSPFKASKGISKAARDHVADTGPQGSTGHDGSDGSDPFKRMNRYGTWQSTAGENISYGCETAESIIIQLLVDDGVASRGHRKNILNGAFKVVGVGFGPHAEYDVMCVQDYAGGYKER